MNKALILGALSAVSVHQRTFRSQSLKPHPNTPKSASVKPGSTSRKSTARVSSACLTKKAKLHPMLLRPQESALPTTPRLFTVSAQSMLIQYSPGSTGLPKVFSTTA